MNKQCPPPIWVSTAEQLAQASQIWAASAVLAVDTEFMRTDTFYPYLGLVQVSDGEHCWLIDPLADMDLGPVKTMLLNPQILKIFHSCSEDLEILQLTFESLPSPIVDTQVGAALAGLGFSRGYNALLAEVVDVELDKGETRSNWLQRPLTESQCRYAAADVYFLFYLYQSIQGNLEAKGRAAWLAEESRGLLNKAANPLSPAQYYQKIKGGWKLDLEQLSVLQAICQWREHEAMKRNMPRNRIIKDRDLFATAKFMPETMALLAEKSELHPGQLRRYGATLVEFVVQGRPNDSPVAERLPEPLSKASGPLVKSIKKCAQRLAEELNVAQELLSTKQDVDQLVRYSLYNTGQYPQRLSQGWRSEVVSPALESVVADFVSDKLNTDQ